MSEQNSRRKVTGDPRPQLNSVDLAAIRARYVGSRLPAETAADMEALWLEVDRLRFALVGEQGKVERLLQQIADLDKQLYVLRARLPGAGGPV